MKSRFVSLVSVVWLSGPTGLCAVGCAGADSSASGSESAGSRTLDGGSSAGALPAAAGKSGTGGAPTASGGSGAGGMPSAAGKSGAGGAGGKSGGSGGGGRSTEGGGSGAGSAGGGAGSAGGGAGAVGDCDAGTSRTEWATGCVSGPSSCAPGAWLEGGPEPSNSDLVYQTESEHFVIYAQEHLSVDTAAMSRALSFLEETVWGTYFGGPMYMQEPYCDSSIKLKNVIHLRDDVGLQGGSWHDGSLSHMGMWIGPASLNDQWGLAHEFMHGVQSVAGGMSCGGSSNYCGWWFESHANWAAHQTQPGDAHCSELLVNATHLHLGNLRNRYCNWQFAEYLKDKYCYAAVNDIWTRGSADDPFSQIMTHMGWSISGLNDFLGEWAMHNITWDYSEPPPTDGSSKSRTFLSAYGDMDATVAGFDDSGQRRQRKTRLEALDDTWASTRRFATNFYWAPQRWGYNVVELFPESGASEISLTFKGVPQSAANSEWRYGLVATDSGFSTARYSALHVGSSSESGTTFCVNGGERVWLVVMATPSVQVQIPWDDHSYPSLYRYPWMVELGNAWPAGFENGVRGCADGTAHENGGGCVASGASVASSAYVGPYAQVLGGTVSDNARIEDHAIVLSGAVSDNAIVGGLTVLSDFSASGNAIVRSTFLPIGYFGASSASGSAELLGDLECYANKSSGSYTGLVDDSTGSVTIDEVTIPPPYSW